MIAEKAVARAVGIAGTCVERECAWLYQLGRQAPMGGWFVELGTYLGRTLAVLCAVAQEREAKVLSIDDYSYTQWCNLDAARANVSALGYEPEMIDGDSAVRPEHVGTVSLLFVDSLHTRQHFDAEMRAWLPGVALTGIVACHDYRSPRWPEITGAVDHWFPPSHWLQLGLERRLVAFRRIANGR